MRSLLIVVAVIVIIIVFVHHTKSKAKDTDVPDDVNPGEIIPAVHSVVTPTMSAFKTDGQKHNDVQFMINKILTSNPPEDDSDVFGKGGWKDWRTKNFSDRSGSVVDFKSLVYRSAIAKVTGPEHDYYLNYTYPGLK